MAINKSTSGRMKVGALIVGDGPSEGGRGNVGGTGTPATIKRIAKVSAAIDPGASIAANTTFESSAITVTGVRVGDMVTVVPPAAIEASLVWSVYVSANDQVKVRIANPTAGSINTAAKTWVLLWHQLVA